MATCWTLLKSIILFFFNIIFYQLVLNVVFCFCVIFSLQTFIYFKVFFFLDIWLYSHLAFHSYTIHILYAPIIQLYYLPVFVLLALLTQENMYMDHGAALQQKALYYIRSLPIKMSLHWWTFVFSLFVSFCVYLQYNKLFWCTHMHKKNVHDKYNK